jgi:hypothetical protein
MKVGAKIIPIDQDYHEYNIAQCSVTRQNSERIFIVKYLLIYLGFLDCMKPFRSLATTLLYITILI